MERKMQTLTPMCKAKHMCFQLPESLYLKASNPGEQGIYLIRACPVLGDFIFDADKL